MFRDGNRPFVWTRFFCWLVFIVFLLNFVLFLLRAVPFSLPGNLIDLFQSGDANRVLWQRHAKGKSLRPLLADIVGIYLIWDSTGKVSTASSAAVIAPHSNPIAFQRRFIVSNITGTIGDRFCVIAGFIFFKPCLFLFITIISLLSLKL